MPASPICILAFSLAFGEKHRLSGRERQIFVFLLQGYSTNQFASSVGISWTTAKHHRGNLFRKTKCKSLENLLAMALTSLSLTDAALDHFSGVASTRAREEVLGLLLQGHSNKEMSRLRQTSISSTKTHVSRILQDLNLKKKSDLIVAFFLACNVFPAPLILRTQNTA